MATRTISYHTWISQNDGDKVIQFIYDGNKYDYSDELYWNKNNYEYKWFDLVIKEYNLKLGNTYWLDHKHNADNGFSFWVKRKRHICNDFKICSLGHLWKQKFSTIKNSKMYIKVKKNIFN